MDVLRDKFHRPKPNVGPKPPSPPESMLFQRWLLNVAIIGFALPGPATIHTHSKPAFVGLVDYEGCRGDLRFKAGCVSLGQVLKDRGMSVSRLAFGPQVVICGRTRSPQSQEWCSHVSPYPLHLRAEKRDRLRPCLQRPCRWALRVFQRSWIHQCFQVSLKNLLPLLVYFISELQASFWKAKNRTFVREPSWNMSPEEAGPFSLKEAAFARQTAWATSPAVHFLGPENGPENGAALLNLITRPRRKWLWFWGRPCRFLSSFYPCVPVEKNSGLIWPPINILILRPWVGEGALAKSWKLIVCAWLCQEHAGKAKRA